MADLVACLSTGKGTWGHVSRIIEGEQWNKVFLIGNEFSKENFKCSKPFELITIDPNKPLTELTEDIRKALYGKISGLDVGVNLISGEGKEHMAILGALLKLGLGIRLIALTKEGIKEI